MTKTFYNMVRRIVTTLLHSWTARFYAVAFLVLAGVWWWL